MTTQSKLESRECPFCHLLHNPEKSDCHTHDGTRSILIRRKGPIAPSVGAEGGSSAERVSLPESVPSGSLGAAGEEWTTVEGPHCFYHLLDGHGNCLSDDFHDLQAANLVRDAHNLSLSQLREHISELETQNEQLRSKLDA